jgi:hypothetical protein
MIVVLFVMSIYICNNNIRRVFYSKIIIIITLSQHTLHFAEIYYRTTGTAEDEE